MIALDLREQAVAAGDWILNWVAANGDALTRGELYTHMTPAGQLVTDVLPEERIAKVVDTRSPKQEFWHVGTAMAYLVDLYESMSRAWGRPESVARPYLDAALALLEFELTMPLDTYLWPSKCKVGWGAGELLRVLVQYDLANAATLETVYQVAERVALFTFLDSQLAHGGWSLMHYPLACGIPEMEFGYKPLAGAVCVPQERIEGSRTIWLSGEEITGEFLGEMASIAEGVAAMDRRIGQARAESR
jgi:hypothetical protein